MAIFSDAGAPPPAMGSGSGDAAKGWESIGSLAQRKKENVMEPTPWAGSTLKAGHSKKPVEKMMVFKDEV
jgi:checkpoint serine/threonine-protein kinase